MSGLAAHWRCDRKNMPKDRAPTSTALLTASSSPPFIDMWAPTYLEFFTVVFLGDLVGHFVPFAFFFFGKSTTPSTVVGDDERFSPTAGVAAFFFELDCFKDGESVMPSIVVDDDECFSVTAEAAAFFFELECFQDGASVIPSTAVGNDEGFSVTAEVAGFFMELDFFPDVAFTLGTSPGVSDSRRSALTTVSLGRPLLDV